MNTINYNNIARALNFYQGLDKKWQGEIKFNYVEVPWYVTESVMNVTKPKNILSDGDYYLPTNDKYLVASAEQSFIYEMFKGIITSGYYVGVTPCFRFEKISDTSRKCFMKVELIYISNDMEEDLVTHLHKIMEDARFFFEITLGTSPEIIATEPVESQGCEASDCYDINFKGYELGSYGIRQYKNLFRWVYGTGCAEPRLSIIQKI